MFLADQRHWDDGSIYGFLFMKSISEILELEMGASICRRVHGSDENLQSDAFNRGATGEAICVKNRGGCLCLCSILSYRL